MPLPLPNLDTLRFADLVEEAKTMIPRYAPAWTDHNAHDPGITLIELFAWFVEQTGYRANRIPDSLRRKFLALAGYQPRPARPARVPLSFTLDTSQPPRTIPADTLITGTSGGVSVPFRTLASLDLLPLEILSIHVWDRVACIDQTSAWQHRLPFAAWTANPQESSQPALVLGFSRVPPLQHTLSLWLRFEGPGNDADERERLRLEQKTDNPPHHSAKTSWEYYDCDDPNRWIPLQNKCEDYTRAFTLDGPVRLTLPKTVHIPPTPPTSSDDKSFFFLRCRLESGAVDAAPILLDVDVNVVEAEQAVPPLLALDVAPGADLSNLTQNRFALRSQKLDDKGRLQAPPFGVSGPMPCLTYLPGNPSIAGLALLGQGSGEPSQRLSLPGGVVAGKVDLWTLGAKGWTRWHQRTDLDASKRADADFMLDPATSEVVFGDGEHGRVLRTDETAYATYFATVGALGNLAAGADWAFADGEGENLNRLLLGPPDGWKGVSVTNHCPAAGGADAENLDSATGRAAAAFWAHERLVENVLPSGTLDGLEPAVIKALAAPAQATTLADYERLALDVPGTRVARVHASLISDRRTPSGQAVQVLVVPELPGDQPTASDGLMQAVANYLGSRRTVGTALWITTPSYACIDITVKVSLQTGVNGSRVLQEAKSQLSDYLHPLRGGPNGRGWPFSRNVYRSDILIIIENVPGIDHVASIVKFESTSTLIRQTDDCLMMTDTVLPAPGNINISDG